MSHHKLKEYPIKYLSADSLAVLWEYIKKYIGTQTLNLPASATLAGTPQITDNSTKVATTAFVAQSMAKALDDFKVMQYKGTVSSLEDLNNVETTIGYTYIADVKDDSFVYTYTETLEDGTIQTVDKIISSGDMFIWASDGWDVITSGSVRSLSSISTEHIENDFPVFSDTTGRFVKDSGISISTITNIQKSISDAEESASIRHQELSSTIENVNTHLGTAIQELIDDLSEEAEERSSNVSTINSTIDNELKVDIAKNASDIEDLRSSLEEESSSRSSSESALSQSFFTQLSNLTTIVSNNRTESNSKIESEINRASSAEESLQSAISSEISNREQAIANVNSSINSESTSRQTGDSTLQTNIDTLRTYLDNNFITQEVANSTHTALENRIMSAISDMKSTSFEITYGIDFEDKQILYEEGTGDRIDHKTPEDGIIYLVKSEQTEDRGGTGLSGSYVEYIRVNTQDGYEIERIGTIASDLGDYYTKTEIDETIESLPLHLVDSLPYPGESNTLYILSTDTSVWTWSVDEESGNTQYVQLGAKDKELRTTVSEMQATIGSISDTVSYNEIEEIVNSVAVGTEEDEDGNEVPVIQDFTNLKNISSFIKAYIAYEGWIRRNADTILTDSIADGLDTKVNISDIQNNLTSQSTDKPLSAYQGSVLNGRITTIQSNVEQSISEIGNVFTFKGTVDNPEQLPVKTSNEDTSLNVGDVYQVKSTEPVYSALEETEITVGETDVSSYYTRSGEEGSYIYESASGYAEEGITYYTKSYAEPTDENYATYSYTQSDPEDYTTGSWAVISVSISNVLSYFSTEDDVNNIISEYDEEYGTT